MKLEWMCLSNRLTSLSAALGGCMHLAVELHTAAGRVTRVPQRAQHLGWARTEETNKSTKSSQSSRACFLLAGMMNSSQAVTSKRGRKAESRWNAHQRTWSSTFLIPCSIFCCFLKTMFHSEAFFLSSQSAFGNTFGEAQYWIVNVF